MKTSDLIVPPPIPFADQTFGELAEAAKIYGVPAGELIDDVLEGANTEQVNPANVSSVSTFRLARSSSASPS